MDNKIISETKSDYSYIISLKNNDSKLPTVVWIPGGGLSSLVFAFSGIGPYLITKQYKVIINKNQLQYDQLFLDVRGTGFSRGKYPENDEELVTAFNKSLLKICNKFEISRIILIGVSYGGKTAIQISKSLNKSIQVLEVVGITPFFNPINSQSYIPYPGNKFNYYKLNKKRIRIMRQNFKKHLNNHNYEKAVKYIDEKGKFSIYTKRKLGLSINSSFNIWNIKKYNLNTLGNWIVPNILNRIYVFFSNHNINTIAKINPGLSNLYRYGKNRLKQSGNYFINSKFWNKLAYTHRDNNLSSYLTGVNIDKLQIPVVIIAGNIDIITSYQGLRRLVKSNPNIKLYRIKGGSHLLSLNHGNEIKKIIEKLLP